MINFAKLFWKNRNVQYPRSYSETENAGGGITHAPVPGTVTEEGTPFSAQNMNRIEKGIEDCVNAINEIEAGQEITFTEPNADQNLVSGESLSVSMGKISRGLRRFWDHLTSRNNPHNITKESLGLGNVENKTTDNLTVTFTDATEDQNLVSGERLSIAMGKISRAMKRFWAHLTVEGNPHGMSLWDFAETEFLNDMGRPAVVSSYIGSGSHTSRIMVNGVECYGQQINLGFTPSMVAILCPVPPQYYSQRPLLGGTPDEFLATLSQSRMLMTTYRDGLMNLFAGQSLAGRA